jgi:transcriptional regulator with XRE-family HTH domain
MSFDATFHDLRSRRRIPMRLFKEKVGISPSYIHSIEKEGLLPSPAKLEKLASVFVAVATEQEAADPNADARRLFQERERTAFVHRLGVDPDLAEVLVKLRELDAAQRADLVAPLSDALSLFQTLGKQERQGTAVLLHELVEVVAPLQQAKRHAVIAKATEAAYEVLEEAKADTASSVDLEEMAGHA